MNKTKLAIIGLVLGASLSVGTYSIEMNSKLADSQRANEQIQKEIDNLREELNKSKEDLKDKDVNISEKQKQIQDLTDKLKSWDNIINDLTTPISYSPSNITSPSNASLAQIRKALNGTSLEGLEVAFLKSEKMYHVNSMFMIGLVANESGWGTSRRAVEQNNMTGFEVYSALSEGGKFSSKEESILITAKLLSESYLNPNGSNHNGTSIWAVNISYCQIGNSPNYSWSSAINSITNDLVEKVNRK
jgi:beta-N-acetylglucosaminidase